MAVYLVCEGEPRGLDERVLDAAVINPVGRPGLNVLLATTGGGKGHGAVCTYLQKQSQGNVAVSIQDRDVGQFAQADATWGKASGSAFTWRRHEIENYLLHPRLVIEFVKSLGGVGWAVSLPTVESDAEQWLQSLAGPLFEDHAAKVLGAEIVQLLNQTGGTSFGPLRPKPPTGRQFPGQAEWEPALVAEAARIKMTGDAIAQQPELDRTAVEGRYRAILTVFQNPTFLNSGDYLRDLGGHELMKALAYDLRGRGAPAGLTDTFLADELLKLFPQVYQPNNWFVPDDFAELATILAQY